MTTIEIPYDERKLELHIDEKNLQSVLSAKTEDYRPAKSPQELVGEALQHPLDALPLHELAIGKRRVTIVTSDHTRSMPSSITLPLLLSEIRRGNPDADITILIATGLHRASTRQEMCRMFGTHIVETEKIVNNDAFDDTAFNCIATLPSGADLWVNRLALSCDLLVTEGFIEPHFFAGFSGGRKSILPGVCNASTVKQNHSYKAISNEKAAAGVLEGNPIHEDMVYAARAVRVQFILNVALNSRKEIIAAFAGDLEQAHTAGVEFVRSMARCEAPPADIVVTSNGGYPLDQNLYQSPKAVATASACAKKGGVLIMCCGCRDGVGGSYFSKLIAAPIDETDRFLSAIPPEQTLPEQWCAQIYFRILRNYTVILVTTFLDHALVRQANMIPASDVDEALAMAYEIKGAQARVTVIPDGVSVIIEPTGQEESE
ncbi:MAG: nickel-dependent lactate racemase [Oscillospiraceae bacterium]|nr:nickel-dependent lactate racemase [Oscillospiraceae bacterium]